MRNSRRLLAIPALMLLQLSLVIALPVQAMPTPEDKFPAYPARSASDYSSCQTQKGIRVAIEPVSEGDQQKKYFRTKFDSQGFLPILVVLENGSGGSSLLLRRDLVTYHLKDQQVTFNSGAAPSARSKGGERAALGAGVALATTSAMGVALPLMFIGLKMIAGASEVKQNILVKELRSQTIPPGKSGSGFLYVPVGKPGASKRTVVLNVPLSLDDSSETLVFTFDLEVGTK